MSLAKKSKSCLLPNSIARKKVPSGNGANGVPARSPRVAPATYGMVMMWKATFVSSFKWPFHYIPKCLHGVPYPCNFRLCTLETCPSHPWHVKWPYGNKQWSKRYAVHHPRPTFSNTDSGHSIPMTPKRNYPFFVPMKRFDMCPIEKRARFHCIPKGSHYFLWSTYQSCPWVAIIRPHLV